MQLLRLAVIFLATAWMTTRATADDIAVFYALETDLKVLLRLADSVAKPENVGGRSVHRVVVGKHRLLCIKMGSGCVETAVSAGSLLARFRCRLAVSIGPMGSLNAQLAPGKWAEVAGLVAYQRTEAGAASEVIRLDAPKNDAPTLPPLFPAMPQILVASGEAFIQTRAARDHLGSVTKAEGVEMNAFGLQVACARFGVPLRIWRVVSDEAAEEAGSQFRKFVSEYDGAGATALVAWVRQVPVLERSIDQFPAIKQLTDGYVAPRKPDR